MSKRFGQIVEMFSSIQGEGVHVGRRHLFLRLAGCGFGCAYCDQPEAQNAPEAASIQTPEGGIRRVANPVPAERLARAAAELDRPKNVHHAASITGGEPLEQAAFLADLLPLLKEEGFRVLLETNGVHPEALAALLPWTDIVSMDYKVASATGHPAPAELHCRSLEAAKGKELYVKVAVAADTPEGEIEAAALAVAEVGADIPLIIQPLWPEGPGPEALMRLQLAASGRLRDVRVIGQMHRALGFR